MERLGGAEAGGPAFRGQNDSTQDDSVMLDRSTSSRRRTSFDVGCKTLQSYGPSYLKRVYSVDSVAFQLLDQLPCCRPHQWIER
jgi:hypothetical protein